MSTCKSPDISHCSSCNKLIISLWIYYSCSSGFLAIEDKKIEKDNDTIRALWVPPSTKPSRQDICLKLTPLCTLSLYSNCLAKTSGSSELVLADPLNLYCPMFTHYTSFYSFPHIFQCSKDFLDP